MKIEQLLLLQKVLRHSAYGYARSEYDAAVKLIDAELVRAQACKKHETRVAPFPLNGDLTVRFRMNTNRDAMAMTYDEHNRLLRAELFVGPEVQEITP